MENDYVIFGVWDDITFLRKILGKQVTSKFHWSFLFQGYLNIFSLNIKNSMLIFLLKLIPGSIINKLSNNNLITQLLIIVIFFQLLIIIL